MDFLLRTYNLTKQYKKQKAVDNVNISLKKGEIYGFLGQNGAGKTTTIRMIMGLIKPTAGEIELFGEKITQGKYNHFDRIGSIIEFPGFYPNLTAVENLEIHRRLMGVTNKDCIERALEYVAMHEVRNKKAKSFSLGMKQRLGIARALLHNPELLILDEPTNGLDPIGIKEIRQLILDLSNKRKTTIFISSHLLSEIEQLATKIGVINRGRLLEEIDLEGIKQKSRRYVEIKVDDTKKTVLILEQKLDIYNYRVMEDGAIRVYQRVDESGNINRVLYDNGVEIKEISVMNDNLEDYFIKLTGGISIA